MVAVTLLPRRSFALGPMLFVALAAAAVGIHGVQTSSATFTTMSQTVVQGRADLTSDWLRLWSQGTDPVGLTGYATRRLSVPLVPAAEGSGEGLAVDLGGYPDYKQDFVLTRVFTLETPAAFPDPAIDQVTVTATLIADESGRQPLRKVTLTPLSGNGNQATATLTAGQRYQLNLTVRSKRNLEVGATYFPHVVISVTFAGAPGNYYVYDIPLAFMDAGQ